MEETLFIAAIHCVYSLCLFTLADPTLFQRSFKCNTPYFFTPHQLDLTETETAWLNRFPAVTHTSVLAALLSECFRTSLSTLVHNSRKFEHASKHYVKHSKRKLSRRHEKIETHMPWGWRVKHTQSVNWTVITLPASVAVSQNTHTHVHRKCSLPVLPGISSFTFSISSLRLRHTDSLWESQWRCGTSSSFSSSCPVFPWE